MPPVCQRHRKRIPAASGYRVLESRSEIEIPGLEMRRIRVRYIARENLLAMRAKSDGVCLVRESRVEFAGHGNPKNSDATLFANPVPVSPNG